MLIDVYFEEEIMLKFWDKKMNNSKILSKKFISYKQDVQNLVDVIEKS